MKKQLRILAALLAVILALALIGCDKQTDTTSTSGSPDVSSGSPDAANNSSGAASSDEDSQSTPSQGADNAPDQEKPVLVMGTNAEFPPYEFHEDDEIVGIDAEIAAAIADKLGMTLRIDDMDFYSIIAAVTTGKADIGMAGMTVTEERLQSINFSISYATGVQVVIVPEDSPITDVDDLFADGAYYSVGVQEATTGDIYASDDIEGSGLGKIYRYNRGADAVTALTTGKVDCVIIDNEPAKAFISTYPGLKILETEYAVEDYAIAVAKENTELLDSINAALTELIEDGTVQSIIDKYINAE